MADDDGAEESLVIGIDFGTTYSGVAWATTTDFKAGQVNFITSWPGNGREEGKVPTEIWYNGDEDEPNWGYDIPPYADPFRWFKLLLLKEEDLAPIIRENSIMIRARDAMNKAGKTAVELVADYLRLLWRHTMSSIEKARGESVIEALQIHIVVTVPAIWQNYAREDMKSAAWRAGLFELRLAGTTKLTFAPEPEVAALPTLLDQGAGVRQGQVYLICDAGGGTVDLITYEVNSTNPIVLQEAVEGTGGLCGGIFIDQMFEQMCSGRLESKWTRLSKRGLREIMKDEWEYGVKAQFKAGRAGKEYVISLPAEMFGQSASSLNDMKRRPHIKDGRIHFQEDHIRSAFDPVVNDINELVKQQIEKAAAKDLRVTGIILVGGLGCSPYLYEYLKAAHSGAGIILFQSGGVKPRTAICRGAVVKGFTEKQNGRLGPEPLIAIASTVSRASYGILYHTEFSEYVHLKEDRVWCPHREEYRANDQTRWYLKRGDAVSKIKPKRLSWQQLWKEDEFDGMLTIRIFQCAGQNPPTRKTSSVRKLGSVVCKLDVKFSELPDFESKTGVMMKELNFELESVPSGASVEFMVYVDGRKQSCVSTKIRLV
ncbi:hypothetical protein GGS20DRAFT_297535 [Poronia punctata]|nr:hypothetical protein GGS20DRAFT_297535 [Poronia punctata]